MQTEQPTMTQRNYSAILCCVLLLATTTSSFAAIVYDNGSPSTANGFEISSEASADDFIITTGTTLTDLRFWVTGDTVGDLTLSDFNGTMGWAIYQNNSNIPGALFASGSDNAPVITDTGGNDDWGFRIFSFDVSMGSVAISPGTYWLGLREGTIGSSFDGTEVYWQDSVSGANLNAVQDFNLSNPSTWTDADSAGRELSFQLLIPEPSTLGLLLAGGLALLRRRRSN